MLGIKSGSFRCRIGAIVIQIQAKISDAALVHARDELLVPSLYKLMEKGIARPPRSYRGDTDTYAADLARLIVGQAEALNELRSLRASDDLDQDEVQKELHRLHQKNELLEEWSGLSRTRVDTLLASVESELLRDCLRFFECNLGEMPLDESTLVVTAAAKHINGANVFGGNFPSPPTSVRRLLSGLGISAPNSCPPNADAWETSLYLLEIGPRWVCVHRAASLVEGTYYDDEHEDYPPYVREQVRALLQSRGAYTVATDEIVREQLASWFDGVVANGVDLRQLIRVEGGWVPIGGNPPSRYRFLGDNLGLVCFIGRHTQSALDLPHVNGSHRPYPGARRLVASLGGIAIGAEGCVFMIDGREKPLTPSELSWAASEIFQGPAEPKRAGVFKLVEPDVIERAGADPNVVAYAYAQTKVGKADDRDGRGARIALLLRDELGDVSGSGHPRIDLANEREQEQCIRQAEAYIARRRADGPDAQAIGYVQDAGLQTMGIERCDRRRDREGLVLAGDMFLTRAGLAA